MTRFYKRYMIFVIISIIFISLTSCNSTPLDVSVEGYISTNKPSHITFMQNRNVFFDMLATTEGYKEEKRTFEEKNADYIKSLKTISHMCYWFKLEYSYETNEDGYIDVIHLVPSDKTADAMNSFNKHVSRDMVVAYYEEFTEIDELEFLDISETTLMNNIDAYGDFMTYLKYVERYTFYLLVTENN